MYNIFTMSNAIINWPVDIGFVLSTFLTNYIESSGAEKVATGTFFKKNDNRVWLERNKDRLDIIDANIVKQWAKAPTKMITVGRWQLFLATGIDTIASLGLSYSRAAVFGVYGPPVMAGILITPLALRLINVGIDRIKSQRGRELLSNAYVITVRTKTVAKIVTVVSYVMSLFTLRELAKRVVIIAVVSIIGVACSQYLTKDTKDMLNKAEKGSPEEQFAKSAAKANDAIGGITDDSEWLLPRFKRLVDLDVEFDKGNSSDQCRKDIVTLTDEFMAKDNDKLSLTTFVWLSQYCNRLNTKISPPKENPLA
jgi:hypothetical protein